ncbi:MAG TPA: hypothetical protein VHL34_12200 [Rhizomicrobium sp.]|jgi:hypothetical protein|nr:hypothetical protein [Rhizomicrobium sp.]
MAELLILSLCGLVMLLTALSRMRRELYLSGLLLLAGGLLVLLHTGFNLSGTANASIPTGWIAQPQLCITQDLSVRC